MTTQDVGAALAPPIPSLAIGHGHGHGGESPEIPASFPKTTSLGAVC